MKIAFACDHAGYAYRKPIFDFFKKMKYNVIDCGCFSDESCDYPDYGSEAARLVSRGVCEKAILICTTGIGMSIVSNKFKGVYAALCYSDFTAKLASLHNKANVLCIPAKDADVSQLINWIKIWLETEFEGGRHLRRLNKIKDIEKKNFK